jgi:2-dehydro-3-deoxy-D-gluconate 5-dehydrogenase
MRPMAERLFSLCSTTGIVTGASGGLGLEIANVLVALGASVHAFSRSGRPIPAFQSKISRVGLSPLLATTGRAKSGARSRNLRHHAVDITDEDRVTEALREIGRDRAIDFVVSNAGITLRSPFHKLRAKDWRAIHEVNLEGSARIARLAFPFLKRSRHPGRLVFVSSMAAYLGFNEVAAYGASKAGVVGLMRALCVEWARHGILVNSVAPGWFPSAMTRQVMDSDRRKRILARMPLHRFGRPPELAAAVAFLVSPGATYVNGHDLAVDGGALSFGY